MQDIPWQNTTTQAEKRNNRAMPSFPYLEGFSRGPQLYNSEYNRSKDGLTSWKNHETDLRMSLLHNPSWGKHEDMLRKR